MSSVEVAVVSRDPGVRMAVARAFDHAPASWSVALHEQEPPDAQVVVYGHDVAAPAGAVVFDPARPESLIDDIATGFANPPSTLTVVTSPAGGTGVTTVALHLAAAWNQSTTCLVELASPGGAHRRLGLPDDARTWAGAEGDGVLELAALPVAGGFRVLLRPAGSAGDAARAVVERATAAFDRVVVDAPFYAPVDEMLPRAALVLVVSPTIPSAHRAREWLDEHAGARCAVVTNRLGPGGETTGRSLERILGRRIAVELPCCPSLRDAEDEGRLLTTRWSRWSYGIARLKAALDRAS